jgi:hypothetical protein
MVRGGPHGIKLMRNLSLAEMTCVPRPFPSSEFGAQSTGCLSLPIGAHR